MANGRKATFPSAWFFDTRIASWAQSFGVRERATANEMDFAEPGFHPVRKPPVDKSG